MSKLPRPAHAALVSLLAVTSILAVDLPARADSCDSTITTLSAGITGHQDTINLALGGLSRCDRQEARPAGHHPQPYYTYQVACSPDRSFVANGLCSTTPCV